MSGYECYICAKIMHSSLLSLCDSYLKKIKDQSCNKHNRRFGKMSNLIFETYESSVIPHGKNMFRTASDMDMATMCAYPSPKHA